jgi:hypothetical protein
MGHSAIPDICRWFCVAHLLSHFQVPEAIRKTTIASARIGASRASHHQREPRDAAAPAKAADASPMIGHATIFAMNSGSLQIGIVNAKYETRPPARLPMPKIFIRFGCLSQCTRISYQHFKNRTYSISVIVRSGPDSVQSQRASRTPAAPARAAVAAASSGQMSTIHLR